MKSEKRNAKNFGRRFQPDRWGLFEVEKDNNPPFFCFQVELKGFFSPSVIFSMIEMKS
jgi:hypothetical protein